MQQVEIETYLIKTNNLLLFALGLWLFIAIGVLLSALLSRAYTKNISVAIILIGIIIFLILPSIFITRIVKFLTKKARIKLTDNLLQLEIFNKGANTLKEEREYCYGDIKSYQMGESAYHNTSFIKLVMKNGTKVKYSFFEQTDNEKNVLKNVLIFFTSYNEGRPMNEKITILPNFYATTTGKYCIIGLSVLFGVAVFLQVIYKPQTIPFSLISAVVLYFRIRSQQKKDIELYEKFK